MQPERAQVRKEAGGLKNVGRSPVASRTDANQDGWR